MDKREGTRREGALFWRWVLRSRGKKWARIRGELNWGRVLLSWRADARSWLSVVVYRVLVQCALEPLGGNYQLSRW